MARKKGYIMRKTDHVFFILFPTQPIKTLEKYIIYSVLTHYDWSQKGSSSFVTINCPNFHFMPN